MKRNFLTYFLCLVIGASALSAYRMAHTCTPYDGAIGLVEKYNFREPPVYYTNDHANTSDFVGVVRMALAPTPLLYQTVDNMRRKDTCFFFGITRSQIPAPLHVLKKVIIQDTIQIAICTVL